MRNRGRICGQGKPWGLFLLLSLACLVFCAVPAPGAGATELKAELVKKTEEGDVFTRLTGQVQLTYPDGRTKLLSYRSHLQPVVADGKVYIITTKALELTRIVVYDSAKDRVQSFPIPGDLKLKSNSEFGQPTFSPDGTRVAYYFIGGKSLFKPKFGFVDRTGKMVIPPQFDWAGKFSEGGASVSIGPPGTDKEKIASIDRTGKFVTEPHAPKRISPLDPNYPDDFHEGLARVKVDDKYGFKDKEGNIVIPPRFDYARDFSDGVAWVQENGKGGIIDKTGKVTNLPKIEVGYYLYDFSEGLAPARADKKWGFIDKQGQFVIPPQFHDARSFAEGLARVCVEGKWGYGKWGYIDKTGKMVIPAQYDHALSFSEGLAGVLTDGKYGFIDRTGKMIIPPQYDYIEQFSEGLAAVAMGDMEEVLGGVRVRSWPDWHLLWQSPLCPLTATDCPPRPPLWESKFKVEFDPHFFDPPRSLKYQVPGAGKSDKAKPEE